MSEAIRMAELHRLLKRAKPDAAVYLDFGGFARPTTIDSYRGYYDRPALGMRDDFEGWKGGIYRYSGDETLFVDNPGDSSGIVVTGLVDEGYRVTITTEYQPDTW